MRSLRYDSLVKTIGLILIAVQLFNITVFLSRDWVQSWVFKDIQYHILTADLQHWSAFSLIHPGMFFDVTRAAREG